MKSLNDGIKLNELALELELTLEELDSEIEPLKEVSLVWTKDGQLKPSFLMTDETETLRVYDHASKFSNSLVNSLEYQIENIRDTYKHLDVSKHYEFDEMAFLLVGGRIIDIKLLEKLTTGAKLLPPAPPRPSLELPDAHYYFWMVEGERKHLGEYGLNDYDLPWSNWRFFSFAQNIINSEPNRYRENLEERCSALIESQTINSPEALGMELGIPIVSRMDTMKFAEISDKSAELLVSCYGEHEQSIRKLHSTLKSGTNAPHSFGEFFCWYTHIAYSVAIDTLESNGILPIPPERTQSAVWYREQEKEGLLVET